MLPTHAQIFIMIMLYNIVKYILMHEAGFVIPIVINDMPELQSHGINKKKKSRYNDALKSKLK